MNKNISRKCVSARRGNKCSSAGEQRKDVAGDLGRLHGRGGQELGLVNWKLGGVTFCNRSSFVIRLFLLMAMR